MVTITTDLLCKYGLKNINDIQEVAGVLIYPKEYFCPKDYATGNLNITHNSVSIHHYDASWLTWYENIEKAIFVFLGLRYRALIKRRLVTPFRRLLQYI